MLNRIVGAVMVLAQAAAWGPAPAVPRFDFQRVGPQDSP